MRHRDWATCVLLIGSTVTTAAAQPPRTPVILNEYNAVASDKVLKDGGRDARFGRVKGNGGDWFEVVVTRPRVDLRGVTLAWRDRHGSGVARLTDHAFWSQLPAGLIVTFTAKDAAAGGMDTDLSYDPQAEDWSVNVCLGDPSLVTLEPADGRFVVSNDDWTLTIRDAAGEVVFGPAGEGAGDWAGGGVGSDEVGGLFVDPMPWVTAAHPDYDDAISSTFGEPNRWLHKGQPFVQDFHKLRAGHWETAGPPPSAADQPPFQLQRIETVDIPGFTAEIVGYCAASRVLATTNSIWNTLDLLLVDSLDPPKLRAMDFNAMMPGKQGVGIVHEPTSVAVHPTEPIALVTVLGRAPDERGFLMAYDLRRRMLGGWVLRQRLGYHPDSVAISPDGRWALAACEGEGHPDTPGSLWAVDLSGLTADHRLPDGELPAFEVGNLSELLLMPAGVIEPEFVAFDPQSRFAVVSCQENNRVVLVDFTASKPRLGGFALIPDEGEPDGVNVIDEVAGPDGRVGCLVAVAEEGRFNKLGRQTGQKVSFHWVDPDKPQEAWVTLSRVDVRPLIDPDAPDERRDPESVQMLRMGNRLLAIVGVERGDYLLCLDITDPTEPRFVDRVKVGDRPEGLLVLEHPTDPGSRLIITADEGSRGPGTVSFTRLLTTPPPAANVEP